MSTPTWLAATANQPTEAGQINQFLGTHASTFIYTGVVQAQQTTAGSGAVNSNSLYIAQSFTTGSSQTQIGRVALTLAATGSPPPITVSIQANSAGAPSGTPLVATMVPHDFLSGSAFNLSIPVPIGGLTASTTYWIVLNADGDPSDYFSWSKSNQTSGASTSTNGTSWTAQTYGLLYQVFDYSLTGPLAHTWEDVGARWSIFFYSSTSLPTTLAEYTAGQSTAGYLFSNRSLSYTSGLLTSVT